ncbi:DUF2178 domain-containing protein [Bacillus sp. FJAT-42376]|uniref:DUF2178 domain-containing protein n=1 Tax=Bacillus sp. FJAT-42376 TaxID=2014076 RepID=UPI000F4FDCF7|nr:DUF2178 domain-containing protein [Bacillus sp. FJAT-42376]AZB42391.1 DUF2178 domain-containing protein [Bacillus sp. FJAT-42376]
MTGTLINNWIALSGLIAGVIFAGTAIVFGKRFSKKKRGLDERYHYLMSNAKAISWNITFAVILIAWALVILFEGISLSFFILSGVYVLHCLSLIVSAAYFSRQAG